MTTSHLPDAQSTWEEELGRDSAPLVSPTVPWMDGLQPGVLCPYTSLLTFTMPMCMHGGTMWTSHTRPDVG